MWEYEWPRDWLEGQKDELKRKKLHSVDRINFLVAKTIGFTILIIHFSSSHAYSCASGCKGLGVLIQMVYYYYEQSDMIVVFQLVCPVG